MAETIPMVFDISVLTKFLPNQYWTNYNLTTIWIIWTRIKLHGKIIFDLFLGWPPPLCISISCLCWFLSISIKFTSATPWGWLDTTSSLHFPENSHFAPQKRPLRFLIQSIIFTVHVSFQGCFLRFFHETVKDIAFIMDGWGWRFTNVYCCTWKT